MLHSLKRSNQPFNSPNPSRYRRQLPYLMGMFLCTWWLAACTLIDNQPRIVTFTPTHSIASVESSPTLKEATDTAFDDKQPVETATSTSLPPTRTKTPTNPSSTASPSLPTSTITPQPYINQTSDLLYLSDGKLYRWDHITGYSVLLAENVEAYSVDASGEKISLLRSRNVVANGVQLFDLDVLNFKSMQIYSVIEQSPRMDAISISPDGEWIAYRQDSDEIYLVSSEKSGHSVALGDCRPSLSIHCTQLSWSHDSRSLLWYASEGVWLSDVELRNPQLVQPDQVNILDPEGTINEMQVIFDGLTWSPNDRYALTHIIPSTEGVHWWAVIDTGRGRIVSVPGSSEYASRNIGITWTSDGDLLVLHSSDMSENFLPIAKLWEIVDTKPEILLLKNTIELIPDDISIGEEPDIIDNDFYIDWLKQHDFATFHLGVASMDPQYQSILFSMDITEGSLKLLYTISAESRNVVWSPDGLGALVLGERSQLFFVSFMAGESIDLRTLLGMDAHSFTWLPPAPRS